MAVKLRTDLFDERQRKTRIALHRALERLIAKMDYATISVSLIAKEADVGRPTFYRHYASVDALLVDRLRDDLDQQHAFVRQLVAKGADPRAAHVASIQFALERIAAEPRLYRALLDGSAGTNAVTLFRNQVATLLTFAAFLADQSDETSRNLAIGTFAGAASGFLLAWIEGGLTPLPPVAAELLIGLLRV